MGLEYLPIHEWLKFMVNVGKYSSPMEYLGDEIVGFSGLPVGYVMVSWRVNLIHIYFRGGLSKCFNNPGEDGNNIPDAPCMVYLPI